MPNPFTTKARWTSWDKMSDEGKRKVFWGLGIAAACLLLSTVTFLVLYLLKDDGIYKPHWDVFPPSPTQAVMDCSSDPDTYWAASQPGEGGAHATNRCIFTGDFTTGKGVTEQEVAAKCSAKAGCGGYTVKQTVKYAATAFASLTGPCVSAPDETLTLTGDAHGAIMQAYNNSMPEYSLIYKSAVKDLGRVSDVMLGTNRESRYTTYVRGG